MSLSRKWVAVTASALVVALAAGLVAVATGAVSLGGDTTIQACAMTQNGQLRLVASPSDCLPSETPVSWPGESSASAGPLAYAHVSDDTLDVARSKNVISMTRISTLGAPVYCFVLTATPVNAVASAEKSLSSGPFGVSIASVAATVAGTAVMGTLPCAAGTSAAVVYGIGPPLPIPSSFYVVFN